MSEETTNELLSLTADIVAAHVAHNRVTVGELPELIQRVHSAPRVHEAARHAASDAILPTA